MKKVWILIGVVAVLALVMAVIISTHAGDNKYDDPEFVKFKQEYIQCAGQTSDQKVYERWQNGGYSNILCQ